MTLLNKSLNKSSYNPTVFFNSVSLFFIASFDSAKIISAASISFCTAFLASTPFAAFNLSLSFLRAASWVKIEPSNPFNSLSEAIAKASSPLPPAAICFNLCS